MKKRLLLLCTFAIHSFGQNPKSDSTIPLHAKVYRNPTPPFQLDEKDKPQNFKPFGDAYEKFSWIYKSRARPTHDQHYILIGYSDQDQNDILKNGVYKILSNPLFLCTTPPMPQSSNPQNPPAQLAKTEQTPTSPLVAQQPGTEQFSPSVAPTGQPPLATATPNASVPTAQPTSSLLTAPSTELVFYSCEQASQQGPALNLPPTPQIPPKGSQQNITSKQPKTLVFELKMICSNNVTQPITAQEVEQFLPGSKVYGNSFDLPHHKKCYFIANDYGQNTPQPEIQEMMKHIYYGIKGPYRIFD